MKRYLAAVLVTAALLVVGLGVGAASARSTIQEVTSQVTYNVSSSGLTQEILDLSCPTGTAAINGGVVNVTQTTDPGFTLTQPGQAVLVYAQENPTGSENLGLPRPDLTDTAWRQAVNVDGAIETPTGGGSQQTIPITVTYFVLCG